MCTSTKHFGLAVLAGLIVGAAAPAPVQAQFQMAPGGNQQPFNVGAPGFNPYASNNFFNRGAASGAVSSGFNPYTAASMTSVNNPYSNPNSSYYPPYNPYNYGYPDPYGGYLRGSAEVIDSQGRLMVTTQQAFLMREQVRREKIDNRRRLIEQWLWERNNLPTSQDDFERAQRLNLRRQQNEPPTPEILSGQALNVLLVDTQKLQGKGVRGPDVPLDEDILKKINFAPPGKGAANAGMFKNNGKLSWPLSLRGVEYKRDRDLLNQLVQDAITQAKNGKVGEGTLEGMRKTIEALRLNLTANIRDTPTQQYIESKRFLNDMTDAWKALNDVDAENFLNGKYSVSGKTVADLVRNMTYKGLQFSPAVPGDESAYIALHRLLADYDVSANSSVAER